MSVQKHLLLHRIDNLPLRGLFAGPINQDRTGFGIQDLRTEKYLQRVNSDGFLAAQKLDVIGRFMSAALVGSPSYYARREQKSIGRSCEKADTKYGGDLSRNLDYAAAWVLVKTAEQARKAMDTFQPGTYILPNGTAFSIIQAENNFSSSNPDKPGFRNLDIKMIVDIARPDGTKGYHVCEAQIRAYQALKFLEQSEAAYQAERRALRLMQVLDQKIDRVPGKVYGHLRTKFDQEARNAREMRAAANNEAERAVSWLAQVEGYNPQPDRGLVGPLVDNSGRAIVSSPEVMQFVA